MKYRVRFLSIIIIAAVLAFCMIACFCRRAGYRDYSVDSSGSYLLYKGNKIGDVYGTDNPDYASKDDFPFVIYGVHSSNEKVVFLFEENGYKCYKVDVSIEPSAAETEEGDAKYEKKALYELTNLQKAVGFELTDQRYYSKDFEIFLKKTAEDMGTGGTVLLSSLKALYLATFEATKKWTMPINFKLLFLERDRKTGQNPLRRYGFCPATI